MKITLPVAKEITRTQDSKSPGAADTGPTIKQLGRYSVSRVPLVQSLREFLRIPPTDLAGVAIREQRVATAKNEQANDRAELKRHLLPTVLPIDSSNPSMSRVDVLLAGEFQHDPTKVKNIMNRVLEGFSPETVFKDSPHWVVSHHQDIHQEKKNIQTAQREAKEGNPTRLQEIEARTQKHEVIVRADRIDQAIRDQDVRVTRKGMGQGPDEQILLQGILGMTTNNHPGKMIVDLVNLDGGETWRPVSVKEAINFDFLVERFSYFEKKKLTELRNGDPATHPSNADLKTARDFALAQTVEVNFNKPGGIESTEQMTLAKAQQMIGNKLGVQPETWAFWNSASNSGSKPWGDKVLRIGDVLDVTEIQARVAKLHKDASKKVDEQWAPSPTSAR